MRSRLSRLEFGRIGNGGHRRLMPHGSWGSRVRGRLWVAILAASASWWGEMRQQGNWAFSARTGRSSRCLRRGGSRSPGNCLGKRPSQPVLRYRLPRGRTFFNGALVNTPIRGLLELVRHIWAVLVQLARGQRAPWMHQALRAASAMTRLPSANRLCRFAPYSARPF